MVTLLVIGWFAFCIFSVYLGMRLICWVKREYSTVQSIVIRAILMFEELCDGCKKSCYNHKQLILRACFWGSVIATATTITYFVIR